MEKKILVSIARNISVQALQGSPLPPINNEKKGKLFEKEGN